MRRLSVLALPVVFLCALLVSGCRRQRPAAEATEEETQPLASIIHVADPRAAAQMVKGFHELEQNTWRWTMGKFSVLLRPPAGAAQKGATLQLKFSVPDPIIKKLKSVTLSAVVNGQALAPETYNKPGEYVYTRDVPASALAGDAVSVDFAVDKALPPGDVDQRELGLVVTVIGLEAK